MCLRMIPCIGSSLYQYMGNSICRQQPRCKKTNRSRPHNRYLGRNFFGRCHIINCIPALSHLSIYPICLLYRSYISLCYRFLTVRRFLTDRERTDRRTRKLHEGRDVLRACVSVCVSVCKRVCMCACVYVCVTECVRNCVCLCMSFSTYLTFLNGINRT